MELTAERAALLLQLLFSEQYAAFLAEVARVERWNMQDMTTLRHIAQLLRPHTCEDPDVLADALAVASMVPLMDEPEHVVYEHILRAMPADDREAN